MNSYYKGVLSEQLALIFLWLKGYRCLEKRYKTKFGEIDLIVTNKRRILFVEVKAREDLTKGLEAVTVKSQKRIINAARFYLQKNPKFDLREKRFDVIVIRPYSWPHHLKNAWDVS